MNREQEHQRVIERYIAEGRTVSGGKDNPPDRYVVVTLWQLNDEQSAAAINEYSDKGFRVVAFDNGRVILGNYKDSK